MQEQTKRGEGGEEQKEQGEKKDTAARWGTNAQGGYCSVMRLEK